MIPSDEILERVVRAIAKADGLDWDEQCAYEINPDADDCTSPSCIASCYEDHDPAWARANKRILARAAAEAALEGL